MREKKKKKMNLASTATRQMELKWAEMNKMSKWWNRNEWIEVIQLIFFFSFAVSSCRFASETRSENTLKCIVITDIEPFHSSSLFLYRFKSFLVAIIRSGMKSRVKCQWIWRWSSKFNRTKCVERGRGKKMNLQQTDYGLFHWSIDRLRVNVKELIFII